MFSPELSYQLHNLPKFALRTIGIERFIQMVSGLLSFKLQQYAIEQYQLLAVHPLDFLVQDRLELLWRNRRGRLATCHAQTIHS